MPDTQLCLEALSALCGCRVEPTSVDSQLTPQDLVNIVALKEFYRQEGFQTLEYPSIGSLSLQEADDVDLYGPPPALTAGPAESAGAAATVKINPADFFHPQYDYDFTNIKDGNKKFLRGNEQYLRPCGWNRVALRVLNKYDGGDGWLGTGSDAWPVSYHGHGMDGSLGIIVTHKADCVDEPGFLDAAAASITIPQTKGRGVYSTRDVCIAEKFCKKFKSKVDGKTYKVVLQSRINPNKRKECQRENYWLIYVPEGSNDIQTRAIVQESLRPYGLLLKQV
ncbi:uncharacterized protein LOC115367385 [Myripristis murdjan]|uniref:uncharacterized protein LOC115367385 n=1 Tax=Myripristis murdjan TaxID=586833 RepID=UPI001175DBED|nr:uncharacterized protein LOC115367385 [Myripristis murdjan]